MNKSSLSDRCQEIILGGILGDGSLKISKHYKNARFSFRHATSQKEYFFWKVRELKEISTHKCVWKQQGKDGWGGDKLRCQSAALIELTNLYRLTNKRGCFQIRRKWLNLMTPLSLCVWWLDAGSLLNGKKGVLCTDSFSYDELLIIVRYFRTVWGLNPRIGRVAKEGKRANQFRLWFRSRQDLQKFLRLIMPHMKLPSMLKKVVLLHGDPELQQRWISEVSETTKIDRKVVSQFVEKQKQHLRRFRK